MRKENAKLGVTLDIPPIIQRDLEEYYRLRKAGGITDPEVVEGWRHTVLAGKKLGWLDSLDVSDIEDWPPYKTRFVAECIAEAIVEAVTVPKD